MKFFKRIPLIFLLLVSYAFAAVDINNATLEELVTLKGVGKKKAKRIIKYRKKHGCFHSLKEFKKVKGIKKKTLKKNKGNIIVGPCKDQEQQQETPQIQ